MKFSNLAPWIAVIIVATAAIGLDHQYTQSLRDTSALSGWALLSFFVILASYNLRKKVPFLPLLSSAGWLRAHLAIGVLTIAFFLIHVSWRVPNGALEIAMTLCYAAVAVSGLFGWGLSRVAAKALGRRGEEVIYEQIPHQRLLLREEAHQLAMEAVNSNHQSTVYDAYCQQVLPYLARRDLGKSRFGLGRRHLLAALAAVDAEMPFSSDADRQTLERFNELLRRRGDLDFHAGLQGLLKGWFFIHVPLTWVLLTLTALHVVLVYRFAPAVL